MPPLDMGRALLALVAPILLACNLTAAELSSDSCAKITQAVAAAIDDGKIPGCVVLIGQGDQTVFEAAFGKRQLLPVPEEMTLDTRFDLASLTKPIATATSILLLVERSSIALDDAVVRHLPAFAGEGREAITVRHLLTHTAGLIADNPLADYAESPSVAWEKLLTQRPVTVAGTRFVYSDVGFLLLGKLVEKVSGQTLDVFAQREIFAPLKMTQTGFIPGDADRAQIAPTTRHEGDWLRGRVHDPRARALGGVAGHAGLFSTAGDVARFASMIVGGYRGTGGLLKHKTIRQLATGLDVSTGREKDGQPVLARRGLGWDMQSPYSVNRPPSFGRGSIGHSGFTGTSLWIDLDRGLYVILLSSRLHPHGNGLSNPLAARVGDLAADGLVH